ncbi:MAG: VWA domain-containing protein [bacterium]|nr:VWA domain-containing protein [bacterium]
MSEEVLRSLAVAACLMTTAGTLAAQDERFFETVDVNVVNIEVIVTDKAGKPVTGLGRDDFEVYEDGERMKLSNFYAVEGRESVAPAGAGEAAPPLPAAEAAPGPETKYLNLVVFIDNLNILPQNRNILFENLREYLRERLDPRDQVMVVSFDGGTDIVQPFTNDAQALVAALERLETEVGRHVVLDSERRMWAQQVQSASTRDFNPPKTRGGGPGSHPGGGELSFTAERDPEFEMAVDAAVEHSRSLRHIAERRVQKVRGTVAALRGFCQSLAGIPGRKALVYVSDGLPLRPADSLAQEFSDKFERWMMRNEEHIPSSKYRDLEQAIISLGSMQFDVSREFRGLVEAASSERVAFYPISHQGQRGGYVSADVRGTASAAAVRMEQMTLRSSLLDMAEGTGGVAFIETPNLSALLERVVEDFTSFYSLGYTSPRSESGDFHKIKVKVKDQGLKVRHLRGYRDKTAGVELGDLALGAVHYGIGSNPLEVSIEAGDPVPSGKRKKLRVPVTIKIPFNKLVLVPDEGFHSGRLSLSVTVRDDESGGASPPQQIELPIQVPSDKIVEAMGTVVAYSVELEMKRGSKRISVGVHDHFGQVNSTVSLELSVGDEVNDQRAKEEE